MKIKVWALVSAKPPVFSRLTKETNNCEKQRQGIYSGWPPWEEQQIKKPNDAQVYIQDPNWRLMFKLMARSSTNKQSWSWHGTYMTRPCLAPAYPGRLSDELSKPCEIFSLEINSTSWNQPSTFLLPAWDSGENFSFLGEPCFQSSDSWREKYKGVFSNFAPAQMDSLPWII